MKKPTIDDLADWYADVHMEIKDMLKKRSVEQTMAWLSAMYGAEEAMALFKTFRQVEAKAREVFTTI